MINSLKHLSHGEAERTGTVYPREEKAQGNLINVHKYPKEGCKKGRARLFSAVSSDRTGGNGHKPKHSRFCLIIRKNIFTVWVTKHWHRLPREAVQSPSLQIFKHHLDLLALGGPTEAERLDQKTSRGPFRPQPLCNSVTPGTQRSLWLSSDTVRSNCEWVETHHLPPITLPV